MHTIWEKQEGDFVVVVEDAIQKNIVFQESIEQNGSNKEVDEVGLKCHLQITNQKISQL